MKTYLITGGAGFIGSNIAHRLIEHGNRVCIIDDITTGFERNVPRGAVLYKADISDWNALSRLKIPEKIDCVYHLAAQSSGEASFEDPAKDIDINLKGTYHALRLATMSNCARFIFSSTMSVYGDVPAGHGPISEDFPCNPASYYGCNKLASEKLINVFCRTSGIKSTIFRIFSAYGPGQNMMNLKQGMASIYISYVMANRPVEVKGSLERFRDFIYIDDIIDAMAKCEDSSATYGAVYNLGTSSKISVRELLEIILRAYGKDDFDKWIEMKSATAGDTAGCVADITRLCKAIHWKPAYGLKEGIAMMKRSLEKESARI